MSVDRLEVQLARTHEMRTLLEMFAQQASVNCPLCVFLCDSFLHLLVYIPVTLMLSSI